jgi:hypothetical protein
VPFLQKKDVRCQYRYLILIGNLNDLLPSADRVWFGVQGIWNLIFTLSNLALFLFLPFAYLLCESEGFIGAKVSFPSVASDFCVSIVFDDAWASSDVRFIL